MKFFITLIAGCLLALPINAQDKTKPFSLEGELGFITTSGNTDTTSANAALNAKQDLHKWSNEYKLTTLYKQDTINNVETTTANKLFTSAQANYKLTQPKNRLFVFASYEDDKFSSFDFQSTIAAGWGQELWSDSKSSFEYSVGPGYSFADRIAEDTLGNTIIIKENSAIVRGSINYLYTLSKTSKFTQQFSTEIGSDNTKSRSESAITATIVGSLSMKLALKFDHNTEVSTGRDKLDSETSVNLLYSFF